MIYIAKSYTYYAWCKQLDKKLTVPPSTLCLHVFSCLLLSTSRASSKFFIFINLYAPPHFPPPPAPSPLVQKARKGVCLFRSLMLLYCSTDSTTSEILRLSLIHI